MTDRIIQLRNEYFEALRREGLDDTEETLRGWLWFSCPANDREAVRAAIERRAPDRPAGGAAMAARSVEARYGARLNVPETISITQGLIASGWTQTQIAEAMQVTQATVSRWLRGLTAGPITLRTIITSES